MSGSKDQVLKDIVGKIEREQKLIQGFQAVRRNTNNQEVIQRCNNQIRETQLNIDYLNETLEKLSLQSTQAAPLPEKEGSKRVTSASAKPLYSRFDLIKYDCPSLGHKIQYMLQQLQFKLQVENQYREANEKISQLYLLDGDKSSSSAAQGGKHESDQRIQLLNRSLKKYQGMHVNVEEINRDLEIMNTPKYARKALTGRLTVQITCIRDIDHTALPMMHKKPESIVSIKIDDVEKAKTNGSRVGKFNEEFHIDVDKAHEMEIAVYDKSGSQRVPVALTWVLLSDIAEEIRKKKVANEMGTEGWMTASSLPQNPGPKPQGYQSTTSVPSLGTSSAFDGETVFENNNHASEPSKATQISAWVNFEPVGQILITLSFEKSNNVGRSAFMGALGRHGAIRQKKEEVFEQHGHQFVQKLFYNIMCCALCGEFLRYTGFQCQDCRFLCHRKCYQKVVTKCISKSGAAFDDDAKLNHRIPHRFEPVLNRGTKWCCHCGHILPWGKKNVRKCSECGLMCHAQCTHLVPDFCGMSMEMANKILTTIKSTKPTKALPRQPVSVEDYPPLPSLPPKLMTDQPNSAQPLPVRDHFAPQNLDPKFGQHPYKQRQQTQEPEMDQVWEQKLPTVTTNQFQNAVDSPYSKAAARRPPPQDRSGEKNDNRQSRHDYTFMSTTSDDFQRVEPSAVGDVIENIQNPFETGAYRSADGNAFSNFDYENVNSQLDPGAQPVSHEIIEEKKAVPSIDSRESPSRDQPRSQRQKRRRRKVGLDDFQFLAVLGKGNFGKVMLAESRHTSKLCAIKVLKKDFIVENEEAESVKSEKRVFLTANKEMHPFLLNLHCCFQTENRIYFVMEYVSGGDLMWHIQKNRFSARRAKFYACEVLLALKYFHDNGIVYRDLKLDNILLTTKGHIKIGDYGLCKDGMWYKSVTGTFCGTPDFMAPEIIAGKQYDRSVDWWAFGVLLFQMLMCQSPFKGDDEDDVFNAIEHDEVRFPITMPRQTVLVLQALLTKDPAQRLGSGERDALEIMEHPFFQDVNFDDVLHLRVQPPYLPEITSEHDYSNFDQEFTSETPRLTPVETVLTSEMQEQFRGFSHIADDAPV